MNDVRDVSDVHTLSGAYALDALEPFEARAFERHLAGCAGCRQEVRELQDAAALMGSIEQAAPPDELRDRILRAAARTPQLPPSVSPRSSDGPEHREHSGPAPDARGRASGRRRRLLAPLAAAAAVAAIAAGVVGVTQDEVRSPSGTTTMAAEVHQVFTASDAHSTTMEATNGGTITVATSRALGEMALDTHGLRRLPASKAYQLWTLRDGGYPESQGMISGNLRAGTTMDLPARGLEVAITVEPAGGSDLPTSSPIVSVDPRAV